MIFLCIANYETLFSIQDIRVLDALGAPIKGYGEETSRRRRTHVSHAVYEKDGIKHMRMRFYIKGIRNKGIVELDMKQVSVIYDVILMFLLLWYGLILRNNVSIA